jgi:DinB superfamily
MDDVDELVATVREAARRLAVMNDDDAGRRPSPGKWSAKEIIGHLIDSASNNHQRFVRARWQDDLVFQPYEQDAWVEAQNYVHAPWTELLTLWEAYNVHLARVMRATPPAVRLETHTRHNLDRLAWRPVPSGEPTSLDGFMRDDVGHVQHHLRQFGAVRQPRSS